MTAFLLPQGKQQYHAATGAPLVNGKVYTYDTGTTTPRTTWSDRGQFAANANPVILDGRGEAFIFWSGIYRVVLKDALDNTIWTVDGVTSGVDDLRADLASTSLGAGLSGFSPSISYPASTVGSYLNFLFGRTAAEAVAGVTPTYYYYEPGDVRRYGMVGDAGTTTNNTAFQNAINANAGAYPVRVPAGVSGYYKLTARITAPANTQIILEDGAELRWTATTATGSNFLGAATRPGIEVLGDNFRIEGQGILRGPSVASYVSNEICIYMLGTSTIVRKSGLYVGQGVEMVSWGSYAIVPMFVDNFQILGTIIHDCGYIGILPMSCRHGRIQRNTLYSMTPGVGSEAVAISLSHDSTNYSADPNAATNGRLAVNPFCIDVDVSFNTVYDIPLWTGIDAHGAYDCTFSFNKVYNCRRGIQVASSSGAAVNYAGEGNEISFNTITSRKRDGSATTVAGGLIDGITVNGGSTVMHRGVRVVGNDIEGCGDTTNASASMSFARVREAVILCNTIRNWAGVGFYTFDGDGVIHGNVFGAVSNAAGARCIRIDTASTTGAWAITNNRHRPQAGTLAIEGLRIDTATPRIIIGDNDFDSATTPYVNVDGARVLRRQLFAGTAFQRMPVTYSAAMTIDASTGNSFDITATNAVAFTINAPTFPTDGQLMTIRIRNTSGGALGGATFNAVFKLSAWTQPANGFNRTIDFEYNGANWMQKAQTGADITN